VAVDYVYRIEQPHRAGMLARVCSQISDGAGLIGDIATIAMTRERSIRDISVEVRDAEQAHRLAELLEALDEVRVIFHHDRALARHEGGKLQINARVRVESLQDMRDVYTPGVARVCMAIAEEPALASRLTMIGNTIAICTNGTRVLGLGNIGAVASMPVMEGKAVFYRICAGLNAIPVLIDTEDPDEFIETVLRIAPGFAAIHLEDIRVPDCFAIEAALIEALDVPVMHDDVHGTAVATLAAELVACKKAGLDYSSAVVGQIGLGAAGLGIASLAVDAGAREVLAFDPDESSHARARERGIGIASMDDVIARADVLVATTGRAGLIKPEQIRAGSVVLALTNPEPEISPEAAIAAGAAFAADGSSVNNVLGFPGIFRGALSTGAKTISTGMKLAAAGAIAQLSEAAELVPDALDPTVHDEVARAVADAAISEGLARPERVPAGL
jgi:malate dehydrogenase (oxaloacetate-decarboxylating)